MDTLPPIAPPPVSTTSLPTGTVPPPPEPVAIKPPVLASDILREEIAPIAPAQAQMRIWLGTFALAFALAAVARYLGYGPRSPAVISGSIATAIVAAVAAVIPAPYAARASLAAIAGLVPLAMGARGEGPLAALGFEGSMRAGLSLVLVTLLPGALFFRSRYRAFKVARMILAVVIGASVPTFILLGMAAANDGPMLARAADAILLVAGLTAFFGFMGEETTGFCEAWGAAIIVAHAARLGIQHFVAADAAYGTGGYVVAAIGVGVASSLVSMAIFQLLAALFAREARKVDVHRIVGPSSESKRPPSMTSESAD